MKSFPHHPVSAMNTANIETLQHQRSVLHLCQASTKTWNAAKILRESRVLQTCGTPAKRLEAAYWALAQAGGAATKAPTPKDV